MFGLIMAVFFAWSREGRADGGLGWLEPARRANFATLVSSHGDANADVRPVRAVRAACAAPRRRVEATRA